MCQIILFDTPNLVLYEFDKVKPNFGPINANINLGKNMKLILTRKDFSKLKSSTRADLIATFTGHFQKVTDGSNDDDYWTGVADLTLKQVEKFIAGCSEQTINGLKVLAQHGPKINASMLDEAGIERYGSFQGATTKRTRTITGDDESYLLAWNDWDLAADGVGDYEVTKMTHRSLRAHFNLD